MGGGGREGGGGAESEYAESLRYDAEAKHGVTGELMDGISDGDGVLSGGENGAGRNREDDEERWCVGAIDALHFEKGSTAITDGRSSSNGDGAVDEGGGDQMESWWEEGWDEMIKGGGWGRWNFEKGMEAPIILSDIESTVEGECCNPDVAYGLNAESEAETLYGEVAVDGEGGRESEG